MTSYLGRIVADLDYPDITGLVIRQLDANHLEIHWQGDEEFEIEHIDDVLVVG